MRAVSQGIRVVAFALFAAAAVGLTACNPSRPPSAIGEISRVQGEGMLKRGESSSPLAVELGVRINDDIVTGAAARTELTFVDGTKLTVGEQSEIRIDSFVFDERGSGNRLALDVTGPFRFVTGKLGQGSGGAVSVTTPVATIGVRGTDFWGGPIDGQYGVFLLEGSVTVTTAAGEVMLSAPGTGVDIAGRDQAPGAATVWPQEKVDRAVATVTFQ